MTEGHSVFSHGSAVTQIIRQHGLGRDPKDLRAETVENREKDEATDVGLCSTIFIYNVDEDSTHGTLCLGADISAPLPNVPCFEGELRATLQIGSAFGDTGNRVFSSNLFSREPFSGSSASCILCNFRANHSLLSHHSLDSMLSI